jgi:hypothetical protein
MGRAFQVCLLGAAILIICLTGDARAQYFGRNKVRYDRGDVRVLTTEHFDVYYQPDEADAALLAGRMAERWYTRLSNTLQHSLSGRQPLILYGSHRAFEQTNVAWGLIDENTGGFTESLKRRIVVPFASSLRETDHVLGHEIVHAFQYDIAARHRSGMDVPLWFIEGMAEYLTLGADDPLTSMWMRDAVQSGKLPSVSDLASPRHFPYRWGAALWSYLARRFGGDLPAKALRARRNVATRLQQITGESIEKISTGWHEALRAMHAGAPRSQGEVLPLISSRRGGGRFNLAASISPDGRRIVFLSERDQLSIDLFLVDAASGAVVRKLITTAANARFESLQSLHSAGAWDPSGSRFALATIRSGRPVLTLLDIDGQGPNREIRLDDLDEVFSPTWAPGGHAIAFSAMKGGVTDLFVVDLATSDVRRLTRDAYADLQPAWAPDGRTIAFTTDRFSTDLTMLRFGTYRVGLLDIASGAITSAPGLDGANQLDPAWAPDGASLYVIADPSGVSNVFRLVPADGSVFQVTDVETGVSGVTRLSPALSVAQNTGTIIFSLFHRSAYELHTITSRPVLAGTPVDPAIAPGQEPGSETVDDGDGESAPLLPMARSAVDATHSRYRSRLSLEGVGSPYFSAGGGPFGTYVQGGASLLFGDMLGDRRLLTSIHLSSRFDESAFGAVFVDRGSRWNWGATVEQVPEVRFRRSTIRIDPDREDALIRDRERLVWTHRHAAGFVGYPLNRSQRVELSAGVRQVAFDRDTRTDVMSAATGRVLEEHAQVSSNPSVAMVETGLAFVGDTAMFGATAPILGSRYRFQIAPAVGGLTYTSMLADYRRYLMPIRPYTLAIRVLHAARYGGDADDFRLRETYLGSSSLVRGYGAGVVARSECRGGTADCPALNRMLGTGVLVTKLELRVPVVGALSSRVRYGSLPMDAFVFADAGAAWGGQAQFGPGGAGRALIRSVGAGVRINAMGVILEVGTTRPLDLRRNRWSFEFNLRPGF